MSNDEGINLGGKERLQLYASRGTIGTDLEKKLKIQVPFDVYFQDPFVGAANPKLTFDRNFYVPWEPSLGDGPTSARFAVVDYDGDTQQLNPPAVWRGDRNVFVDADEKNVDARDPGSPQFHQVSVWAVVQNALDFYEEGFGLGRRIPWAFAGNRLIVVPHAGHARNAYYDRHSKSLQFYYFDDGEDRVYTCLSSDIVNHEFGHAVLDGIRPYYIEAVNPETAAFHEFIGDLTAILIAFRNNTFRNFVVRETEGDLSAENALASIAEQFGEATRQKPYLRSALNTATMADMRDRQEAHALSEVLTGAMFDVIKALSKYYIEERGRTPSQAFWHTIQRMQSMALQPLDLLPPVDVTFRDYALVVLRAEELANPTDPDGYRGMMLKVFHERGILSEADVADQERPHHLIERLPLDVPASIGRLAGSRADAYRFLDDNRWALGIPANVDLTVSDLYSTRKLVREANRLPTQIVLEYIWREEIVLTGSQFGRFDGEVTSLLCGGTLVFDEDGNVLHWSVKPGSAPAGGGARAAAFAAEGAKRRKAFLAELERRIRTGRIGQAVGGEAGIISARVPPLTSRTVGGAIRFELSPHFSLEDDADADAGLGSRQWEISF